MKKIISLVIALIAYSSSVSADTIYYASSDKTSTVTVKSVDDKYITVIGTDQKEYRLLAKDVLKIVYDNGKEFYPGGSKAKRQAQKDAYDELQESKQPKENRSAKKEQYIENRKPVATLEAVQLIPDSKNIVVSPIKGLKLKTSNGDLEEGCYYQLLTVEKAADKTLVGCPVVCQVIERRRSNITGAEGRLNIRPIYVLDNNGEPHYLKSGDIFRRGRNIQCAKFWLGWVPIFCFFAGSGAEIDEYELIVLRLE